MFQKKYKKSKYTLRKENGPLKTKGRWSGSAGMIRGVPTTGYPSSATLSRVLDELCQWEGSKVAKDCVLNSPAEGEAVCAIVQSTPSRVSQQQDGDFIFGKEKAGYVMVRPRTSCSSWPVLGDGRPVPLRLHRWLADTPAGMLTRHECDNPSCVSRAHLGAGTALQNQQDRRQRNRDMPRASGCANRALRSFSPKHAPPTTTPQLPPSHRVIAADTLFCVAGFHSPTKRARLAMRQGTMVANTPRQLDLCDDMHE